MCTRNGRHISLSTLCSVNIKKITKGIHKIEMQVIQLCYDIKFGLYLLVSMPGETLNSNQCTYHLLYASVN